MIVFPLSDDENGHFDVWCDCPYDVCDCPCDECQETSIKGLMEDV